MDRLPRSNSIASSRHDVPNRPLPEWIVIVAGVVSVICISGVVALFATGVSSLELVIIIKAILILLLLSLPILLQLRHFDLVAPNVVFSLWLIALFVFRPLYLLVNTRAGAWMQIRALYLGNDDINYAETIALVSVVGIVLGYYSHGLRKPYEQTTVRANQTKPRILKWVFGAYFMTAPISMILLTVALGINTILAYAGRISQVMSGQYYLSLGLIAFDVATLTLWSQLAGQDKKPSSFWLLVIFSNVINFFIGTRAQILVLWGAIWIISTYSSQKSRRFSKLVGDLLVSSTVVAAGILILVIIPIVRTTGEALYNPDIVQTRISSEVLPNLGDKVMNELIPFDYFVIQMAKMRSNPDFLYGDTFLRAIYYVVPRAIWPDKPLPFGYELGLDLYGVLVGTPITLVGELYVNFGLLGAFLGMLFLGNVLHAVYSRMKSEPGNYAIRIVYAYTVANMFVILTRSFSTVAVSYLIFLILLWLLLLISGYWRQTQLKGDALARL